MGTKWRPASESAPAPQLADSKRRKFVVEFSIAIEIDPALLSSVLTDEWRSRFYDLHTPEAVAEHLAFNLLHGRQMRTLDGFADQDPDRARIVDIVPGDAEESG